MRIVTIIIHWVLCQYVVCVFNNNRMGKLHHTHLKLNTVLIQTQFIIPSVNIITVMRSFGYSPNIIYHTLHHTD